MSEKHAGRSSRRIRRRLNDARRILTGETSRKLLNDWQESRRKWCAGKLHQSGSTLLISMPLSSSRRNYFLGSFSSSTLSGSRVQPSRRDAWKWFGYFISALNPRPVWSAAKRIDCPGDHGTGYLGHERCTDNSFRSWTLKNFLRRIRRRIIDHHSFIFKGRRSLIFAEFHRRRK